MRRDKNDAQWQAVKAKVLARDKGCRLLRTLNVQQALILIKQAGGMIGTLDPAHVFPVGAHPHMVYDEGNIVMLNRYSHDMLDNCKHPITGKIIDQETRDDWWRLIVGSDRYQELLERSRSLGEKP